MIYVLQIAQKAVSMIRWKITHMGSEDFQKLNERKSYYPIVDDDTIQSLVRYYRLERKKEVLKFVKDTGMKGDTLD